jgi:hypothetical protein
VLGPPSSDTVYAALEREKHTVSSSGTFLIDVRRKMDKDLKNSARNEI